MKFEVKLIDESETERLGRVLASHLPVPCVVGLDGTLGAGKTRLVRAFAVACDVPASEVTSPTFTLWQTYRGTHTVHHLDAYRIGDEDEFDALGVAEAMEEQAITFVEWSNRIENCLPKRNRLRIRIDVVSEEQRLVTLESGCAAIEEALGHVDADMQREGK